jgi:hypothetical protein
MRLQATLSQVGRDHRSEMIHPTPNGLVGHRHSAFRQQVLDVTQAEGEPEVESYRLVNDLWREPVSSVDDLLDPAGYRVTRRTASPSRRDNALFSIATASRPFVLSAAKLPLTLRTMLTTASPAAATQPEIDRDWAESDRLPSNAWGQSARPIEAEIKIVAVLQSKPSLWLSGCDPSICAQAIVKANSGDLRRTVTAMDYVPTRLARPM